MSAWSKTWPREPGVYWLWDGKRTRLCRVALGQGQRPMWIGEVRIFYPEDTPGAQFMPADVPDPPLPIEEAQP